MNALIWFTVDLRLHDHPALLAAAREHDKVLAVYVKDERDPWRAGGATNWWLHHSLHALGERIKEQGGQLILARGETQSVLRELCRANAVNTVYCTRAYEPWLIDLQQKVHNTLQHVGVDCKRYAGRLLLEPDQITNRQGKPFQVFTPYYKYCIGEFTMPHPHPAPRVSWHSKKQASERLSDWALLPHAPDWAKEFADTWEPGEANANTRLQGLVRGDLAHYANERDLPMAEATSKLSPYLHFGEISPRHIWYEIQRSQHLTDEQKAPFLRQLIWREFSHYLLYHWPRFPTEPFRAAFNRFPWRRDQRQLEQWQSGQTGYPIVDAGMRQLWRTGWMHNRVRMITASFLTKHLLLPWQAGAEWFWDTLVDADLANNSAGWQWVAGCGADAAPYFRIFNPILQGEKFDLQGHYVRRWVPELTHLPNQYIHQPWKAPAEVLHTAGVSLGNNYPQPMVDHGQARQAALDAYAVIKQPL